MAPKMKPTAVVQWWLDKRGDLQRQLAIAREAGNARDALRLKKSIERIDVMLKNM